MSQYNISMFSPVIMYNKRYQVKNALLRRIFDETTSTVHFFPTINTSISLTISRRKREDDEIDGRLKGRSKNRKRHCKNNSTCSRIGQTEQVGNVIYVIDETQLTNQFNENDNE